VAAVGAYVGYREIRARAPILRGRVALITGGSRGLGLMLARTLAREEGCRIVICARDRDELERARDELEREGAEVLAVPCDVSDRPSVERLVEEARRRFAAVDVLVNNAGVLQVGPVDEMTMRDFREAMDVNFWGTVHATLAALPLMRARGGGRIVNITSIGGKVAVPHLLPYDCAKFAAIGFSEGLRAEVARERIRVTTVVPGLMRTGSVAAAQFKGRVDDEYAWFKATADSVLTSLDAHRAARRIVRAVKLGRAEVVIGWPARLLRLGSDLAPGLTARLASTFSRLLPSSEGPTGRAASSREIAGLRGRAETGGAAARR
jgi:NAD(P)-dependent dehydrogenase (short-subunit alcohol dehydrogenase family)